MKTPLEIELVKFFLEREDNLRAELIIFDEAHKAKPDAKQALIDRVQKLDGFRPYFDGETWCRDIRAPNHAYQDALGDDNPDGLEPVGLCYALDLLYPNG
jgi:hypothetical protein